MNEPIEIKSALSGQVSIDVIEGHFATQHSHITHYMDMTRIKANLFASKEAARLFASSLVGTPVETIISLDRTKMLGAFVAEELSSSASVNGKANIAVISPETDGDVMILRDNMVPYVKGKRVLILTDSATTGKSIAAARDGIEYYGGTATAVAAVFGADFQCDLPIYTLFGIGDVPTYASYPATECPICRSGKRVDAVVNSYGYSKIL